MDRLEPTTQDVVDMFSIFLESASQAISKTVEDILITGAAFSNILNHMCEDVHKVVENSNARAEAAEAERDALKARVRELESVVLEWNQAIKSDNAESLTRAEMKLRSLYPSVKAAARGEVE